MRKVLYITYDGLTDPLGQSQVLPYLKGLSAAGYSITVLSCEKDNRLSQYKADIEKICAESNINWHYIPFTRKPPIISKILDLYRLKKKAFSLYRTEKFSWIHCRSYIASGIGLQLKKKFKTGFLFDMRDFWIDEKIDDGSWNLKNPIYKIIYRRYRNLEQKFFTFSDAVVCLTDAARQEIIRKQFVQNHPEKVFVIPCCADLNLFRPSSNTYPANPVLCYLGSIGNGNRYMIIEMLNFYKIAEKKIPGLKFLILSQDAPEGILKFVNNAGIVNGNIQIMSAKRSDLPAVLSTVNYGIFFYKPTYARKSTSPVKLGEMLGMGIPIVCNKGVGDVDQILSSSGAGIAIADFTDKEYEQAATQLSLIKVEKSQIRLVAEDNFSLTKGIELYKSIYKELSATY